MKTESEVFYEFQRQINEWPMKRNGALGSHGIPIDACGLHQSDWRNWDLLVTQIV